ncbi:hypothetical protein GR184_06445 [Bacillus sp. BGMRC0062]|nr:hypothetical protein [Bacillus sp. BGMRC0062]
MSEWEVRRLDEVADRIAVKNSAGHQRVLTVAAGHGLVDQEEYFNKRVASADLSGYWVVEPGDFVYNKSTSKDAPWGVIARWDGDEPAVVTSLYIVFRVRPVVESDYLLHACNSTYFFDSLRGKLREGARAHGLLNVRLTEFLGAQLVVPPIAEQRRIVDVVATVDAQIVNMEQETQVLGRTYTAFLEEVARSHPHKTVGSVVVVAQAGGTPSRQRPDFYGGDIPWLKSGEVDNDWIESAGEFISEAGLKGSSAKIVPSGSTVVAMYGQGDTKGRAGFVRKPVATNQAVLALVPDETQIHPRLLLHAVRSQTGALRSRAIGAAQPNLSKALVTSHEIPVPTDIGSQQMIVDAADSLTRERTVLVDELARLRAFRSALLASLLNQEIEIPKTYYALTGRVSRDGLE